MPGGNRTGPWGRGAKTGRGAGYCGGENEPGFATAPWAQAGFGRGRGGGFGRGRGRGGGFGRGRGWGAGFGRGQGAGRGWDWGPWTGPTPPDLEEEPVARPAGPDPRDARIHALEERLARLEREK